MVIYQFFFKFFIGIFWFAFQAIVFFVEGIRDTASRKKPFLFNNEDGSKTFGETMSYRVVAFWKEAMKDEMASIFYD